MIVFDLRCAAQHHIFEAWFGSSADYEDQQRRGLVQCPICGGGQIEKAAMAPRVGAKGNRAPAEAPAARLASAPEDVKQMLAAMAAAQGKLLEGSDYVGDRFAEEARSMHLDEIARRPIHGSATREQTKDLIEEGIAIAPLPFPVVAPDDRN